ncbi:MAG: permease prefix domain 1-containing protein [Chloroflexota bacterium]|nr:permease prefix domain 1-containing protein [Chloroflexota bacterium]
MNDAISHYLARFKTSLYINPSTKESAARELYAHLQDKSRELREEGFDEEEAEKLAIEALGPPESIAKEIYETHAQGNWQESLFAALPHLMIALLFVSYYWQNIFCLSIALIMVIGVTIYGWHQGKPPWLMPWLGYYLLPVIVSAILLIYLSKGWEWLAALIYTPLALFVVIYIAGQVARQDRLYASLMLAPLPVVFSWLLSLGTGEEFVRGNISILHLEAKVPWVVISFLVLAVATATLIRLKQRQHKIAILLIPSIAIPLAVVLTGGLNPDFWSWFLLTLSLCAFVSPFWIHPAKRSLLHKG